MSDLEVATIIFAAFSVFVLSGVGVMLYCLHGIMIACGGPCGTPPWVPQTPPPPPERSP